MIKDADRMTDGELNKYISSLENTKSIKSIELLKINEEFRGIDEELNGALEVRELRVINKITGDGK